MSISSEDQEPVISVIIPAWQPKDFEDLRASIKANADVAAEWIVVDDGSGPDYEPIFASLIDMNVHVLKLFKNGRQAAARNAGLAIARGAWVKFLDADDRLDTNHLAILLAAGAPKDILPFASTCHCYPDGRQIENLSWAGLAETTEAQLERMIFAPFVSHCGPIYPRELLLKIGGYDESLVTDEDGDLLLRILLQGVRFRAVSGVNYFYQHHQRLGRVSHDDTQVKIASRLRVCDKLQTSLSKFNSASFNQALAHRLDRIALSCWFINRNLAYAISVRAEALAPEHRRTLPTLLSLAWRIGGCRAVIFLQRLARPLRRTW